MLSYSLNIVVVNRSTLLTDTDASLIAKACNRQVKYHFADEWGLSTNLSVKFVKDKVPVNSSPLYLEDEPDIKGFVGYHSEDKLGNEYSKVFIKPILDKGGTVYSSSFSVSTIVSHEILEMILDPWAATWVDGPSIPDYGNCYALEVCDPVQSSSYEIPIFSQFINVCNFVLPSWFDGNEQYTRWDFLGKLEGSFKILPGGYCLVRKAPGTEKAYFGNNVKVDLSSRANNRLAWHKT